VAGEQEEQVIGEEEIDRIAAQLGISHAQASSALAMVLPEVVDRVSPGGQLPDQSELDDLFGQLAAR
jgi:uncharacterized protein YidB (DUF937 family)